MQGHIVVITRNGSLGGRYPLTSRTCLFGKSPSCDVRVYVDNVAVKHCVITAEPNERAYIRNLSPLNATLVNGIPISETQYELQHADVITVGDRHFRWEYYASSKQKTPASKTTESDSNKSPTCMVQVPMSVFKQKRHSSPGILRENKIISFSSQNEGEPRVKRRKTMHSVTDLVKPVNKQLTAVTQPVNSPKSLNTFKVLLKSAENKRKSLHSSSKEKKKVISTKVRMSKSLSPQKVSPKTKSLPSMSTPIKGTQTKSTSHTFQKSSLKRKTIATMTSTIETPNQKSRLPFKISSESKLFVSNPRGRPRGSLSSPARKLQTLGKSLKVSPSSKNTSPAKYTPDALSTSNNNLSPIKGKRGRPKTPQNSSTEESVSTPKSPLLSLSAKSKTSRNTPGKTPKVKSTKTPQSPFPSRKSVYVPKTTTTKSKNTPTISSSRLSKTPKASILWKSVSPNKSYGISQTNSIVKNESAVKEKSLFPTPKVNRSTPLEMEGPHNTSSRGRPSKAAQSSPTTKSISVLLPSITIQSSSPINKTPSRRGRSSKTPLSTSCNKHSLKVKSEDSQNSPLIDKISRTSTEMLSKSPQVSPTRKSVTSVISPPKTSRSSSPINKTPSRKGRPPKTPQISSNGKQYLQGKLSASPQVSPTRSVQPVVSPSRSSGNSSLVDMSPRRRDRSPKTPLRASSEHSLPDKLQVSLNNSLIDQTYSRTSKNRHSKSPQVSPKRKSVPPVISPSRTSQSILTVNKTPGRSPKTPRIPPTSPGSSNKPTQISSPVNTTPGRCPKTPKISPRSPASSHKPSETAQSSTPIVEKTTGKTPRGRPSKVSLATPPTEVVPHSSKKLPLFTEKASVQDTPESEVSLSYLFQSPASVTLNADSDKTKSTRRSALKIGLSSSKGSTKKPLLMSSSSKKAEIVKLKTDSKRKFDIDAEAKAERAAKRLKMETPKSLTKNKKAALLVCHSPKSQKRPLFSEVLKSHLSTVKKKQAAASAPSVVARRAVKQIAFQPPSTLAVPKSFNFNSTGHANSPETIIIRKKIKGTPFPMKKVGKGRKSTSYLETKTIEDKNLEGVSELFKTPKYIVSSLKSASSVKKPQNVRVRFSLQNDVQSPSGRKSSVAHSDEVLYFGSPMITSKKYTGTPRPSMKRISNNSLMHTSIMEESPLAQEIYTPVDQTGTSRTSDNAFDFSAYSPSSPTLQLSRISDFSPRKSIDFIESPSSENSNESPKRKRSLRTPMDNESFLAKQFSFASVGSQRLRNSAGSQPSPDNQTIFSQSDLFDSSIVNSDVSRKCRVSRELNSKPISTSKEAIKNLSATKQSPVSLSLRSSVKLTTPNSSSSLKIINRSNSMRSTRSSSIVMQTPQSASRGSVKLTTPNSSSSLKIINRSNSMRSTRSSSIVMQTPQSASRGSVKLTTPNSPSSLKSNSSPNSVRSSRSSKNDIETPQPPSRGSVKLTTPNSPSSLKSNSSPNSVRSSRSSKNVIETPQPPSRGSVKSTTPNSSSSSKSTNNSNSVRSTRSNNNIMSNLTPEKASPNLSLLSSDDNVMIARLPKRISSTPQGNYGSPNNTYSPVTSPISIFDKTSSVGKKSRKSNRMNASNAEILTPDCQVPVAAVKPSTRRKQVNESCSSLSESVSLPAFSVSHEISERSVNRSFAQKMMDSRASCGLDQPSTSRNTTSSSLEDLSFGSFSSSRRKRKSSGCSSIRSVDATTFDFTSALTPKIPREMFVSPLENVSDDLSNLSGVKRIFSPTENSPVSNGENVKCIKKISKSSKTHDDYTDVLGVKRIMNPNANSPISGYIDVRGVKRLLKSPKPQSPLTNYSSIEGIKELFKHSPVADYTNVAGIKNLYASSAEPNYVNVRGVRRIFKQTKVPNSPDIAGVEVLFESPTKLTDEFDHRTPSKPIGMVTPTSRQVKISESNDLNEKKTIRKRVDLSKNTMTSPEKDMLEGQSIPLNNKSRIVKKTRQTRHQTQIEEAKESEKVDCGEGVQINNDDTIEEQLPTTKRKTRGRVQSPTVQKSRTRRQVESKPEEETTKVQRCRPKKEQITQIEESKDGEKVDCGEGVQINNEDTIEEQLPPNKRKTRGRAQSPTVQNSRTRRQVESKPEEETTKVQRGRSKNEQITQIEESKDGEKVDCGEGVQINNDDTIEEQLPPNKRKTRGRVQSPTVQKSRTRRQVESKPEEETTKVQRGRSKNEQITQIEESKDGEKVDCGEGVQINNEDTIEEQLPPNKRKTRGRAQSPTVQKSRTRRQVESKPEEETTKVQRGRPKKEQIEAEQVNTKSPDIKLEGTKDKSKTHDNLKNQVSSELPKTTSRKRKTDSSHIPSSNLLTGQISKSGTEGENRNFDNSPSEPSTSSLRQENGKRTRRVQFNMEKSSAKNSPMKRAAKSEESSDSTTAVSIGLPTSTLKESRPKRKGVTKAVTLKTKSSPKLKASTKGSSPSPKKSNPTRKAAKGVTKAKTQSPAKVAKKSTPSPLLKRRALKTRAVKEITEARTPSPTKVVKVSSPSPKDKKAKKKAPAKTTKLNTKSSPKAAAPTKVSSPSPKDKKAKKKAPAKTTKLNTKSSPKAAAPTKSSPPAKRVTRSRK